LNSRVNFRRCICRLRLHETPNLGVHETGSRPGVVSVLRGQSAIPMNVVGFPFSEDALAQQREVQQALLKTLSGETPLKVAKD
jgi:hypothetical protein